MTPHDKYYRFQKYDSVTTRKADWIYERLRHDPTPIDVALIGTSRMGGGLSASEMERKFCEQTGRRIHIANLSIPNTGRNMHYVIAKEAIRAKAPHILIVELNETEPRKPHDGFIFLADASDVLTAPGLINLNYVSDLIRLPGRQFQLFIETLLQRPAIRHEFDVAEYHGAHLDRTHALVTIDGGVIDRDVRKSASELNALYNARLATQNPLHLAPPPLHSLEYRYSRFYLKKIERAARARGARTAYLYVPAYRAPTAYPGALKQALQLHGRIFSAGGDIVDDPDFWFDATHVNASGAMYLSAQFGRDLAARYPELGDPQGCEIQSGNR